MSLAITSFLFITAYVSPALAVPTVSLLIDNGYASSGTLSIKSVLSSVSARKGSAFHFGSTYDTYTAAQSFQTSVFTTFFNHVVAENGCKWDATEPTRGTSDLTECLAVQSFATTNGNSFRGHNTFWHSQTPVSLLGIRKVYPGLPTDVPSHGCLEASRRLIL